MILLAVEILQASATSLTGLYECEVKYSVTSPMTSPAQSPHEVHRKQSVAVTPLTNAKSNDSGKAYMARKYKAGVNKTVEMMS